MAREPYQPAALPQIDAVGPVDLRTVYADRVDKHMKCAGDAPRMMVSGDAASLMADLWRALPLGEQARCHTPPYGLHFFSGKLLLCEASICWECFNIFGEADGRAFHYEFDATAETSRQLLAEIKRLFGHP